MSIRFAGILLLGLLWIGCDEVQKIPPFIPPGEEKIEELIRQLNEEKKYLNALTLILNYGKSSLLKESLEGARKQLQDDFEKGDYARALNTRLSLRRIASAVSEHQGADQEPGQKTNQEANQKEDPSVQTLLYELLLQELRRGKEEPVIEETLRKLSFRTLAPERQKEIRRLLAAQKRGINPALPLREENPSDQPRDGKPEDGTVTVLVDRGIQLKHGRALPEIVIGSGFFIRKSGYLLTNYHVIASEVDPAYEGYSRLYIRESSDRERIPARVIGWYQELDTALLKAEITPHYVFRLAPEEASGTALKIGSRLRAIGSPLGLEKSLTTGTLSSRSRRGLLPFGDIYQIDVPVNPGNSGGPLLNAENQVLGVVFSKAGSFEGISFAVPAYWIRALLPSLYRGGAFHPGWFGIVGRQSRGSVRVLYVMPDSPASYAGIRKGDLLKSIDDQPVRSIPDIQYREIGLPVGRIVQIDLERNKRPLRLYLQPEQRPPRPLLYAFKRDYYMNLMTPVIGVELREIRPLQKEGTVASILPGSLADTLGVTEGDRLQFRSFRFGEQEKSGILTFSLQSPRSGFWGKTLSLNLPADSADIF